MYSMVYRFINKSFFVGWLRQLHKITNILKQNLTMTTKLIISLKVIYTRIPKYGREQIIIILLALYTHQTIEKHLLRVGLKKKNIFQ